MSIAAKSSSGYCCQEFVGPFLPRVCQAVVVKNLPGHCSQEFIVTLVPSVCWVNFAKSSSGFHCQKFIGTFLQVLIGTLLLVFVVMSLLGRCCQVFVRLCYPRVYRTFFANSLLDHFYQEFLRPLLPRIC